MVLPIVLMGLMKMIVTFVEMKVLGNVPQIGSAYLVKVRLYENKLLKKISQKFYEVDFPV